MAMENNPSSGDFWMIMADLESENPVANIAAMNHASALIGGGKLPEPLLVRRLIAGLLSNLAKPHHEIAVKRGFHSILKAIWTAIISNNMNMDSSARSEALHAILCYLMDRAFLRIQRHGSMVRMFTVPDQLTAVKIMCTFFRSSPGIINDARCVRAFASLMLSPHAAVVCACAGALPSLSLVVPGFGFTMARAYCHILIVLPPQSSLQISSVILMLERLKQISTTMVDHPGFNDLAMHVLGALANRNFAVRKKVLNLAVSLLTPGNVSDVLRFLKNELDLATTANIPIEYEHMLEEAIRECHSAYPESIILFIQDPMYSVFSDCFRYIKDIMDRNPMLRAQLLRGLLRALRHVKSSPVCAAAVWAISVCSESQLEAIGSMDAILCLFGDLLDRRDKEKLILEAGEVEHEYMLPRDYYGVRDRDSQGDHLKPWLMEMEELLFVHIGLTQQADGSYSIASSSKCSGSEDVSFFIPSLDHTDNLEVLLQSGDVLLADAVESILSMLQEKANELE
ncbi:unnamed protein product [Urochloa decumbens]|uniref:Coatomer beta subunit n=1 Tax=Urochloa decumbens TaxID=240449 RepID=A0ABC9GAD2_9POAL